MVIVAENHPGVNKLLVIFPQKWHRLSGVNRERSGKMGEQQEDIDDLIFEDEPWGESER